MSSENIESKQAIRILHENWVIEDARRSEDREQEDHRRSQDRERIEAQLGEQHKRTEINRTKECMKTGN